MKKNIVLLFLLIGKTSIFASSYEPINAQPPSAHTLNELEDITSKPSYELRGEFDEGPPTEGGGTGGPVGVPIGNGFVPIMASVLIYLLVHLIKKKGFKQNILEK